jgi:hypothetical protein
MLLSDGKIDVGEFLGGILGGPYLVFLAAIAFGSNQSSPIPTDQLKGVCSRDGDADAHCLLPVPTGGVPGIPL